MRPALFADVDQLLVDDGHVRLSHEIDAGEATCLTTGAGRMGLVLPLRDAVEILRTEGQGILTQALDGVGFVAALAVDLRVGRALLIAAGVEQARPDEVTGGERGEGHCSPLSVTRSGVALSPHAGRYTPGPLPVYPVDASTSRPSTPARMRCTRSTSASRRSISDRSQAISLASLCRSSFWTVSGLSG